MENMNFSSIFHLSPLYIGKKNTPDTILLLTHFCTYMQKGDDDSGKFRQLDEIIYIDGYPGYQQLASLAEKSMKVVCDVKGSNCCSCLEPSITDKGLPKKKKKKEKRKKKFD